jgi:SAM-dependent methyltransferase
VQTDDGRARLRARELAAQAAAAGDGTGWFEQLYEEADAGVSVVPWADGEPNPHLVSWIQQRNEAGNGRKALVVGCGLGYDAEYLAGLGFTVTAFDVAPSAVAAAQRENPGSPVTYVTTDLLHLPEAWTGAFDLVVEVYTVQPLYGPTRAAAIAALPGPVAPGGTLLVIARATDEEDPVRDPTLMPWPLTRAELDAVAGSVLSTVRVEQFLDDEDPPKLRWRAEFQRALPGKALRYASVSTRIREQSTVWGDIHARLEHIGSGSRDRGCRRGIRGPGTCRDRISVHAVARADIGRSVRQRPAGHGQRPARRDRRVHGDGLGRGRVHRGRDRRARRRGDVHLRLPRWRWVRVVLDRVDEPAGFGVQRADAGRAAGVGRNNLGLAHRYRQRADTAAVDTAIGRRCRRGQRTSARADALPRHREVDTSPGGNPVHARHPARAVIAWRARRQAQC